jgi:cell wall-associated NlpC family hydrolase
MRRRRLLHAWVLAVFLSTSQIAAAKPTSSWAQAELKTVVAAGLMAKEAAARPNDSLTKGELETIVAGLEHVDPVAPSFPSMTVTMAALDSKLVGALGLGPTAKLFQDGVKSAGLPAPSRFGSEVVARLLGLRTNHPAALDKLELSPGEPATRAEAAYSAARIMRSGETDRVTLEELAPTFFLPALTPWQKRVLATATRFIGYPYVWGGESELTTSKYGPQPHGGFDCSGFVWRVYKLQAYPDGGSLADVLRGRTTYAMSGEVPKAARITQDLLQPADVVFFGARGAKSKPAEIDHMGIYLGNGWFIHSSSFGVAMAPLTGWYEKRLAWGRRPLAEASLVSGS